MNFMVHPSTWKSYSWRDRLRLRWQIHRKGGKLNLNKLCPIGVAYWFDWRQIYTEPIKITYGAHEPDPRWSVLGELFFSDTKTQGRIVNITDA